MEHMKTFILANAARMSDAQEQQARYAFWEAAIHIAPVIEEMLADLEAAGVVKYQGLFDTVALIKRRGEPVEECE